MPDILHNLTIQSSAENVYYAITAPKGLDAWWPKLSSGHPEFGAEYQLCFSNDYDWSAIVLENDENTRFALEVTVLDKDWTGTKIKFFLTHTGYSTDLSFIHTGWKETNDHFRVSSNCWAKYLRLLKKFIEEEVVVPYDERKNI